MAKAESFSIVGILVQGPRGEIEELVTSDEPDLTHNFEIEGADGEYALFGIFPRGSVRQGYASFNPGRVHYFAVTLDTPVEGQVERIFIKRLGEVIQAKQLRLVPWKDGSNPMVGLVNQAGKQVGLKPFMQPGDIEDFQTLPEPGDGQAHLTKGMSVSKPSGHWTVVISVSSEFSGSNADTYLKLILAAFEETAAPMIEQGLLAFYRIVNRMTDKVVKEQWSQQGRERAANETQAHQRAINYLYHLADTMFKDYPNLQADFIKTIQLKHLARPNGEPVTKVSLQTDPTIKALMGEESPVFRLAIQALLKMETGEFRLLDKVLGIYRHMMESSSSIASKNRAFDFLLVFGSLHYAGSIQDQIEKDIERLPYPEDIGHLLTFGDIRRILDNVKELEEVGYGSVVAKVQHAASQGLEAVATDLSKEASHQLSLDADDILSLKGVVEIPPKLEEFLRQTVDAQNKPRLERKSEREVKKPTKATQGKSGTGMSYDSVEAHLRLSGLMPITGGTKYTYWGLPGTPADEGTFIRLAVKTVRLVQREKTGRKINDIGITDEAYYGKLTPAQVDTLIASLKRKSSRS